MRAKSWLAKRDRCHFWRVSKKPVRAGDKLKYITIYSANQPIKTRRSNRLITRQTIIVVVCEGTTMVTDATATSATTASQEILMCDEQSTTTTRRRRSIVAGRTRRNTPSWTMMVMIVMSSVLWTPLLVLLQTLSPTTKTSMILLPVGSVFSEAIVGIDALSPSHHRYHQKRGRLQQQRPPSKDSTATVGLFSAASQSSTDNSSSNDTDANSSLPTTQDVSLSSSYLSTCVPGMAHILESELHDLASSLSLSWSSSPSSPSTAMMIWDIQTSGNAAVTFRATRGGSLYALCWLRTAHRILELVASTDDDDSDDENGEHDRAIQQLYTRDDIHDFIRERVNVKELLGDGRGGLLTLSVKVVLNNPRQIPQDISHSHYTALTVKNALCDAVRELREDKIRPDVDLDDPDVPLVAILRGEKQPQGQPRPKLRNGRNNNNNNNSYQSESRLRAPKTDENRGASMSLYRSLHPPGSLHKRGYRLGSAIHKAAMKESMAAGLLIEAGWLDKLDAVKKQKQEDFRSSPSSLVMIDPMCGSGSLCLEAAMMAADIAPGLMRMRCGLNSHSTPPVTRWKSRTAALYTEAGSSDDGETHLTTSSIWKNILLDATKRAKRGVQSLRDEPDRIRIWGNDIHDGALDISESALRSAGLASFVTLTNDDCYDLELTSLLHGDEDVSNFESNTKILVATNPPWGVRLTDDIADSWDGLRHFIRDKCPSGTEVFVLSGDKSATSTLKLKRDRMIPIQTGDQHLRWIRYTIGRMKMTQHDRPKNGSRISDVDRDSKGQASHRQRKIRSTSLATSEQQIEDDHWI